MEILAEHCRVLVIKVLVIKDFRQVGSFYWFYGAVVEFSELLFEFKVVQNAHPSAINE